MMVMAIFLFFVWFLSCFNDIRTKKIIYVKYANTLFLFHNSKKKALSFHGRLLQVPLIRRESLKIYLLFNSNKPQPNIPRNPSSIPFPSTNPFQNLPHTFYNPLPFFFLHKFQKPLRKHLNPRRDPSSPIYFFNR